MDDLIAEFLTETNESLAALDLALVRLERVPDDPDTLAMIFRLVHTIKGTCGFLGLPRLETVAHAAETVLGRVRDGELSVTPEIVTLTLRAIDSIKAIIVGLRTSGAEPPGDDVGLIAALKCAAEGDPAVSSGRRSAQPQEASNLGVPVAGGSSHKTDRPGQGASDPSPVPADAVRSEHTIRVAVDTLEHLMTLVSELVLARNQLLQLARSHDADAWLAPLQLLSQLTTELQQGMMKTRMQPIGSAWNKLPRMVRDLGHELGKQIELDLNGGDTELDRQVLELIRDPLTHMVRNSADHGLEPPDERRLAGKPETGIISLDAFHRGGHIVVEVADDGRGISAEGIRAKALAQGLGSEAELAAMNEAQLHRFIFRAGFSTAAALTTGSGRCVGMDVVRTNIERIGGTVELRSTAGAGTTFTIKIPLTLAIVSVLLVEAGGERLAIPQPSVRELVRTARAGTDGGPVMERIGNTQVLRLRDHLLPLVSLQEMLGLASPAQDDTSPVIVILQHGTGTLGLIVDRVFDTEEIVVKPVAPILRHITLFGGTTILGDGSVIMILDPNGVARACGMDAGDSAKVQTGGVPEAMRSGERTAMLLFRAGGPQLTAVPLGLVSRIEEIPREAIEITAGPPVTQYRGRLMPLIALSENLNHDSPRQLVLVFAEPARSLGLMLDEIVDVVEDRLDVELTAARPGLLGTAVVGGRATDVLDTGYWLTRARTDWFGSHEAPDRMQRILAVEDSDFFRRLLVPSLSAAGYHVTAAAGAAEALQLRDAGQVFDAIISDIEMPGMDGLTFARTIRAGSTWSALPMLALSARARPADVSAALGAGFTAHVTKFDREALIAALQRCLADAATA